MSIQEKSAKGTPYAIVKFSDKQTEFELFLFSENLVANREKIKRVRVFCYNIAKDKISSETEKKLMLKKL